MRRLLFLNGIKAFEAAARSGSFAAAGLELHVSPAAVSRMVHLLEQRLGVALFERKANRLAMTAAGRAYQSGLTPIFDALASLTAQVTASLSVRVLTIGVGPTFAMRWLIPRLADFRREEPDIDVRITTGGAAAPFGDDWSCGITLGDGNWPGLLAEPLFAADLLPVCSPRLAAQVKRPADLRAPVLLRVAHSPDDWPLWLKAAGAPRPDRPLAASHSAKRKPMPIERPGYALAAASLNRTARLAVECFGDGGLRILLDLSQVRLALKALGVDLVHILGAGGSRRKPSVLGDDLDAAERLPVAASGCQRLLHRLASQFRHAEFFRRKPFQQILLG